MKLCDDNGLELDAIFSVEVAPNSVAVIIESRGGGDDGPRPPRNPDYAPALEVVLQRLAASGAILTRLEIEKSSERQQSPQEWIIEPEGHVLPIDLSGVSDHRQLRLEIGRLSAKVGSKSADGAGNRARRLRMTLDWPQVVGKTVDEIENFLAGRATRAAVLAGAPPNWSVLIAHIATASVPGVRLKLSEIEDIVGALLPSAARTKPFWTDLTRVALDGSTPPKAPNFAATYEKRTETVLFTKAEAQTEAPTADPDALKTRAERAQTRRRKVGNGTPPKGSAHPGQTTATVNRHVRDPEVIAWVLLTAKGCCEVCDAPAPFLGTNGEPFLEVHHVRPLGEGGPDQTDNAVAACPNCHRRLHYADDRHTLRDEVLTKLVRLNDYPKRDTGVAGTAATSAASITKPAIASTL